MTVTDQNLIHEEIKRKLNCGNAWFHSIQNLLSSRVLLKSINIGIYETNFDGSIWVWNLVSDIKGDTESV
jgi:hypothetical protein